MSYLKLTKTKLIDIINNLIVENNRLTKERNEALSIRNIEIGQARKDWREEFDLETMQDELEECIKREIKNGLIAILAEPKKKPLPIKKRPNN